MPNFDSFFQAYAAAFARFDAEEITRFYHDPTVTLRADGSLHLLRGRTDIRNFFEGVLDSAYRPFHFHHGVFHGLEVKSMGARSALVTMEWDLRRADDTVIRRWWQSYNLLNTAGRWEILVSTFHVD